MMSVKLPFYLYSLVNVSYLDYDSDYVKQYGLFKLGNVASRKYFLQALSNLVYEKIGDKIEQSFDHWVIVSGANIELAELFSTTLSRLLKSKQDLYVASIKKNLNPKENYSNYSLLDRERVANYLFDCQTYFDRKHVILIDDMVVTGTVFRELRQTIIKKGGHEEFIYAFSFINANFPNPQDEAKISSYFFSKLTIDEIAYMMNNPEYYITSGMIKNLVSAKHINFSKLASLICPSRRNFIKNGIVNYYQNNPIPENLYTFIKKCISPNSIESDIRALLNHIPSIPDFLIKIASFNAQFEHFFNLLENHNVMRMIPNQHIQIPKFTYTDAGKKDWKPLFIDDFFKKTWRKDVICCSWFHERLSILEEKGNELRELVHPEISKKIGTSQYSFAVYGAFLFREKLKSNDIDGIVINNQSELQIFGSQEMEIPGLSQLFPFLGNDKIDLNVVSINALKNSESETSMSMLCTLHNALFLVGEQLMPVPSYMLLFKSKMMWSRQSWTFLDNPQAYVPFKMISRAKEIQLLLKYILRTTKLGLNPIDKILLDDPLLFNAREYETVAEFYPRVTSIIGNLVDLIDGNMKRLVRDRILKTHYLTPPVMQGRTLQLTHITPDFNQICGISKYSMALHDSLVEIPNLSVKHVSISEKKTTQDPNYFTNQLKQAVKNNSDIIHIHFADGLLRKNNSEEFIEFSDYHAEILSHANAVIATIYELGPRMLSANRLPQNILVDTTHPQRIAMMKQIRLQIKRLLSIVTGVIVHSDEQLDFIYNDSEFSEIVHKNNVQVMIMRHGIPTPSEDFLNIEKRKTLRKIMRSKLKIEENHLVLIQFGFIRSNKYGVDILGLLERNKEVVWLLAGGFRQASHQPYQDQLLEDAEKRGVKDRVIITGRLGDEEISPTFAAADIGIIPYRTGTDSYALATCLGHGFPVIGSFLPFIKNYRRRYGDIVYSALDDERFEEKVQYLANNRDYLAKLCRETAFSQLFDSWYHIALQTKAFYEKILY